MKKLLIGVAALSLLSAGAASAQSHHGGGGGGGHGGGGGGGGHAQQSGGGGRGGGGGDHRGGGQRFDGGARFQGGGQFRGGGEFRGQRYQGNRNFHGGDRIEGRQQFRGGDRFQGRQDFGGDRRFQGSGQFRNDRRFQGGGQFNDRRGGVRNDFRNWRGGRGPWVNDRNWFRNNWRFQSQRRFHGGYYNWPRGWYGHRNWYYGAILPSYFLLDDYILNSWWDYGLYEPPYGYEWVRVGPDILLVDPYSGRVVQVVNDAFY
jgi:Ni/Co efflux regulator RcnB